MQLLEILSRYKNLFSIISKQKNPINATTYSIYRSYCRIQVPPHPTWKTVDDSLLPQPTAVDLELVNHLERLSLVEFGNEEGIDRLIKAVRFADTLMSVNVTGIEPMTTVLEDRALYLRNDDVSECNNRDSLLPLARKSVEEYYVAPPGNIPLAKLRQYQLEGSKASREEF